MPDSPEPPDPGLTHEQERRVRRLLAEARHTGPTPDDVVARLDRVLADLAEEPAREAAVVRLADRRRRVGRMLVAAAAVVVLGVGINQVADLGGAGESASTSAGDSAADESAGDPAGDPGAAPEAAEGGAGSAQEDGDATRTRPYRISEDDFSRDAAALRGVGLRELSDAVAGQDDEELSSGSSGQASADRNRLTRAGAQDVCEPGDWGPGGYVPVLYDRAAGWVVLRRPQGETQVLDLFLCGSEQAVRSVTLPTD